MSNYILILTEGEIEEVYAINNLNRHFLEEEKMHIISFKTNIYSLYSQLKKDDFETDIIEILKEKNAGKDILCGEISVNDISRDEISEIYLLFDYDAHHYSKNVNRSLAELKELVEHFENETEQGKLYLSYPMIEAINYHNLVDKDDIPIFYFPYHSGYNTQHKHFKKIRHPNVQHKKGIHYAAFQHNDWNAIFKHFLLVIHYTMDGIDYSKIAPHRVFEAQLKIIDKQQEIVIISAIPSLIIEYFGRKFYNQLISELTFKDEAQAVHL